MSTDLNQNVCFREIDGRVSDLGHEDCVDFCVSAEILEDLHSLILVDFPEEERLLRSLRVLLQGAHVV